MNGYVYIRKKIPIKLNPYCKNKLEKNIIKKIEKINEKVFYYLCISSQNLRKYIFIVLIKNKNIIIII